MVNVTMANGTSVGSPFEELTANWATNLTNNKLLVAISVCLLSLLSILVKAVRQPAFPEGAPKLIRGWPVFGALEMFGARKTFLLESAKQSPTGNVSTYIGKYQVVGLSGENARRFNFESKALSLFDGCNALLSGTVSPMRPVKIAGRVEDFQRWYHRTLIRLMQKDYLVLTLPMLVSDASHAMHRILAREGPTGTGILDPFDDMYQVVSQLTMRMVGATELANDPALLRKALRLFGEIQRGSSPIRIMFPWLFTFGRLRHTIAAIKIFMLFRRIAKQREREGRKEDDCFQYLIDTGADTTSVISSTVGTLFAGLVNSRPNAAWILTFLATNETWYRRVQSEVDASLQKHRQSPTQSLFEVLQTLTVRDWEAEFPSIDLALRETIRFTAVGTTYRRNISGSDLPIADSGEILPRGAFTLYPIDDIHMNPAVYANPTQFDPARYLPDRAEDRSTTLAFIGWGGGRNPCLGMRFAKLETCIITAMFAAMFDWELVDDQGLKLTSLPDQPGPGGIDREHYVAHKPSQPVRLRYTARQRW